jgi:hypothetical protein
MGQRRLIDDTATVSRGVPQGMTTPVLARTDHRFYTALSLAVACTVLAGFGRTFYFKGFFPSPPLPLILHIHGALCTLWVLLFVTQNILILRRSVRLHQRLGWAVTVLSILVCIASVPVALYSVRHGHFAPAHDAYTSLLAFDFRNIFNFALMMAGVVFWRRDGETHKRLAVLAAIALFADPAIGRIPGLAPALMLLLFLLFHLAGPAYDLATRRRIHWAYLWGVPYLLISIALAIFAARLSLWHAAADWLMAQQ